MEFSTLRKLFQQGLGRLQIRKRSISMTTIVVDAIFNSAKPLAARLVDDGGRISKDYPLEKGLKCCNRVRYKPLKFSPNPRVSGRYKQVNSSGSQ
jgi:hypothetical protein